MKNLKNLKWIYSAGGPLVILGKEARTLWKGHEPIDEAETHYEWACRFDGLWGAMEFDGQPAIIVNDEPVSTTWLPFDNKRGGTIARWIYAENMEAVVRHLENIPDSGWTVDGNVTLTSGVLYMFDSVEAGDSIDNENLIEISLPTGLYEMLSLEYKPDNETHLRLHQFRFQG